LSQRNQEVRKINASKIIYNFHQPKHSQVQQQMEMIKKYKKQRSKSCMNKTENFFNPLGKKGPQNEVGPPDKKDRRREKSHVLEIKELKKQIDEEIKRDI